MPAALVASPLLTRPDLFARLEKGHAEQVTVVTPNRRLAQGLRREFDAHQIAKGLTVWEAPDILPFGAFVERLWEDALYSDLGEKLPLLLTPAQEQHLWEQILQGCELPAEGRRGAPVPRGVAPGSPVARPHRHRNGRCAGVLPLGIGVREANGRRDRCRAPAGPDGAALQSLKTPKLLVAYAFDVLPPQTEEFLAEVRVRSVCLPEGVDRSSPPRTSYPSAKQEIEAAAKWARARLEEGKTAHRRGCAGSRHSEEPKSPASSRASCSRATTSPAPRRTRCRSTSRSARRFHTYPLVDFALGLIELAFHARGIRPVASHLDPLAVPRRRRHRARRAAPSLDVKLRREASRRDRVARQAHRRRASPRRCCGRRSERVFEITKTRPDSPAEWARHFSALLEAAGFPGERALDSEEFQTRAKWHEMLGELAKLERISQISSRFERSVRVPRAASAPTRCSSPSRPTRRSRCSACSSPRACASTACG